MQLVSLIQPENILLSVDVNDKNEALSMLARRMARSIKELSYEDIIQSILEREELGGTALGHGMAIPHGRFDNYDDLMVGILTSKNNIGSDSQPVYLLLMCLAPKSASNLYLLTISAFSKLTRNSELWRCLLTESSTREFIALIKHVEVQKVLTVADIMRTDCQRIGAEATLKELADLFYTRRSAYSPVVDSEDRLIAEVRAVDLLKVGIPDYALRLGNLSFLRSFEPLEELFNNEKEITVKQIMSQLKHTLQPDSSVVEAAYLMTQHNLRQIAVVEKESKKLLGIISQIDMITRVVRG